MKISEIIKVLEEVAPPDLQESYDNAGLIVGHPSTEVERALISLDATEEIVDEAIRENCGLIIAHHPIVFRGLKKLNGNNYVERTVIKAIQNNIAIYAIHTNLDNVLHQGVNSRIADKLGLNNRRILRPRNGEICKLVTFVPVEYLEIVKSALFEAGAGSIGAYDHCSFSSTGHGTFRAGEGTNPFVGDKGVDHTEEEARLEMILPVRAKSRVVRALLNAHPYEEVAYDLYALINESRDTGSGLIGELSEEMDRMDFLHHVKTNMQTELVKYTSGKEKIKKVAVCGGAGSFLISDALRAGADAFITGDIKYHEFFDGEQSLVVCDIGHFESEQFTINLLGDILSQKIPNFAVIFTKAVTNPVKYFH
ncbi:MAG: Nif3-like dinuclear metal center hexameric protein [Bacteroidetes bacterium]|nr:Nif3-like dinuclear metal center hexameric protein [Bacteroidota bacterium]